MSGTTLPRYETTESGPRRALYRCRCGAIRRVDYTIRTTWRNVSADHRVETGKTRHLLSTGKRVRLDHLRCECGGRVLAKPVLGRVTNRECGARCTSATGPRCECSCGGANHGAGHAPAGGAW